MRRWIIWAVGWLITLPVCAQSGPELDALLEAFFAKDLQTVSRHLPPEAEEVIHALPADAKQELAERYLVAAQLQRQGLKISQPGDGVVIALDRPVRREGVEADHAEIYVEKYLSGGGETMVRFRMRHTQATAYWPDWMLTAWLRVVGGDWRVYELDVDGREIHFDDPKYLDYLRQPKPSPNEAFAVGALRTINTAAVTYSSTFPDVGFPESLEVLGVGPQDSRVQEGDDDAGYSGTKDHAGLIDETLSSPPFEKSGYRFTYKKSSQSEYSAIARPVQYGKTGTASYFTDQSGVIRVTQEDREPTAEDPPLQ